MATWKLGTKPDEIATMLNYIRNNKAVRDVIVSGGDPLTLSTQRLEAVLSDCENRPCRNNPYRVKMSCSIAQRIDKELCDMLSKYGLSGLILILIILMK